MSAFFFWGNGIYPPPNGDRRDNPSVSPCGEPPPDRSIVVLGTTVPSPRFAPRLRVVNGFAVVFRNLNRRAGYCRSLHSFRLTTAGR